MQANDFIEFKCLEVTQPIGSFYIGSIDHRDLIEISYADVRRMVDRDVEKYLGVQRPLEDHRVREIATYVNSPDATFPTSIILAISSEDIEQYDEKTSIIKIKKEKRVARIIDGQHRIAGLEQYKEDSPFQINITVFIDMEIEQQALVFSTINLAQTKVNKSLVYDLYELFKSRSPEKTCHNIARLLNQKSGSPFYSKIKMLGRATDKRTETLTQAAFVDSILKYIEDPKKLPETRNILRKGKKPAKASEEELQKYIFKNLFIDEKEAEITLVVWNYFAAVAQRWPKAWNNNEKGMVLNKTVGFNSLMYLLRDIYLKIGSRDSVPTIEQFFEILSKVELDDEDFKSTNFSSSGAGVTELYKKLRSQLEE